MREREPLRACPRCGEACRSGRDCIHWTRRKGAHRGLSRTVVLTPLGWQMSKYGRDPREEHHAQGEYR